MSEKRLIQSITRAADIMDLFISEKNTLGISDFARMLSLPKTTIQGIVQTLVARNYLEKDPLTSRYRLGPMLFQLGMKYATNMDLVSTVSVWMERLSYQFRVPVNVGMLVGNKVVIVLRVEPEKQSMVYPQAGTIIPVHTTCIGKAVLAFMDKDRRDMILEECDFKPLTNNSITTPDMLEVELDTVKQEGVSYDRQENLMGLAGIGGPIYNHTGQVIAGFALSGKVEEVEANKATILDAVVYTSKEVSKQLGYEEK